MILVDLTLRATAILAAALVTTVLLTRGAAATRHLVWTLAVCSVLALPLLGATLPAWTVLPAVETTAAARVDVPRVDLLWRDGKSGQRRATPDDHALAVPEAVRQVDGSRWLRFDMANVAVTVWLLVAAAMVARIAAGIAAVRRIGRHARPADARGRAILDDIVGRIGVDAPIRLLVSRDVSTPMTWGGRHPLLLLPHDARTWSDDRLRMVLLHEVAHIRRADWLSNLAGRLTLACHWFNPLAWVAVRAMTRERERACDDFVVVQGSPAAEYAQHLLDIAREETNGRAWSVAPAMARRSELEGRLLSILTPHRRESNRSTPAGLTIAALAAAACIAAAAPSPAPAPRPQPAPEPRPAPQPSPAAVAAVAADQQEARETHITRKALVGAMDDDSEDVREVATLELALQSGDEVIDALVAALKDSSSQVREKAALGLAFRRHPLVVDALLAAVHDGDSQVREKVVFALGMSGDPRAVPALVAATRDPDAQVREKAVQGLAMPGGIARTIAALAQR